MNFLGYPHFIKLSESNLLLQSLSESLGEAAPDTPRKGTREQ